MEGKIIVFSGFSGVGKNTIINALRSRYSSLVYIPSMTTREMRKGESEGFPYYFVSREEFKRRIAKNYFIEYEEVHGNWYGTPKDKYEEALENNLIVVKDIDVNGAISMKEEFGDHTILVYIEPPSIDELKHRLMTRGDDPDDIIRRLKRVDYELSKKPLFDECVVNEDLDRAVNMCEEILLKYVKGITPSKHLTKIEGLLPSKTVETINMKKVNAIKEAVLKDSHIPLPTVCMKEGKEYIVDGHHRVLGYYAAGVEELEVDVITKEHSKGFRIEVIDNLAGTDYESWKELLQQLKENQ